MKSLVNKSIRALRAGIAVAIGAMLLLSVGYAQEDKPAPTKPKPVKNTFESVWIIDNQTVMVPVKGTLEFDILHRFGTVKNGYEDFWGFFAPSNIRLGVSYVPIKNLNVGIGITKTNMLWDASAKYAILHQAKGGMPFSVSYYANMAYDTRKTPTIYDGSELNHDVERFSYFHQVMVARKITERFSLQAALSLSHQNAVGGFYTNGTDIYKSMKFDHFALSFAGRYKFSEAGAVIFNYDQPLTQHSQYNPNPNLGLGIELNTSSHSFQFFVSNYSALSPQRNNLYNTNNPFEYTDAVTNKKVEGGQFLIGFNITRLWNY